MRTRNVKQNKMANELHSWSYLATLARKKQPGLTRLNTTTHKSTLLGTKVTSNWPKPLGLPCVQQSHEIFITLNEYSFTDNCKHPQSSPSSLHPSYSMATKAQPCSSAKQSIAISSCDFPMWCFFGVNRIENTQKATLCSHIFVWNSLKKPSFLANANFSLVSYLCIVTFLLYEILISSPALNLRIGWVKIQNEQDKAQSPMNGVVSPVHPRGPASSVCHSSSPTS